MAFFKFRKGADAAPAAPTQAESVEVLRRRARHRLIGAAVLVLLGVVGFPLLFDTQPRPVAVDIPIEIPDRAKARPLPLPAASAPQAVASGAPAAAPAAPVAAAPAPAPAPAAPPKVDAKAAEPKPEPKAAEPRPEPKAEAKVEPKPAPKAEARPNDDGHRAAALLDGKPVAVTPAAAADGENRFVVQVGAFADPAKARETRLKVEKAGLKTYTHVAETKDGKRIRVRVGPFATKAEADKAAAKLKDLDLPSAVLTL